jgi:enoyl-CoA hydratase
MSEAVRVEQVGAVMVVHLDDGKANALSAEVIAAVSAALDHAESDPGVGAVVLHGRPGKFCAGFDLNVMRAGDVGAVLRLVSDGGELVRRCYGSPVPVVAASTGHASSRSGSASRRVTSPVSPARATRAANSPNWSWAKARLARRACRRSAARCWRREW